MFEKVKAWGRRLPAARWLWHAAKRCNPRYRSELQLRRERPAGLFQPWSLTSENRYPRIFAFVRERLAGVPEPHILSFGCSTGEELVTLRRYLPQAWITGIDINPWNVAVARRRVRRGHDSRTRIVQAASPETEPDNTFDAIFCMAVFRNGDLNLADYPRCDHRLRFADFERVVADLDRTLRPGGLLAIIQANFRFADTAVATGYRPVFSLQQTSQPQSTPLYGPDNRKLPAPSPYNDVIFLKKGRGSVAN